MQTTLIYGFAIVAGVLAHGDHGKSQKPEVPANADWITKHMAGKSQPFLLCLGPPTDVAQVVDLC